MTNDCKMKRSHDSAFKGRSLSAQLDAAASGAFLAPRLTSQSGGMTVSELRDAHSTSLLSPSATSRASSLPRVSLSSSSSIAHDDIGPLTDDEARLLIAARALSRTMRIPFSNIILIPLREVIGIAECSTAFRAAPGCTCLTEFSSTSVGSSTPGHKRHFFCLLELRSLTIDAITCC